ncbi:MAG: DUF192 domain-containing protein [Candidatus Thiodiazotropha sp.]
MKLIEMHKQREGGSESKMPPNLTVQMADSYFSRLRGLMGKKSMGDTGGLLLKKCSAVHTIGMRYTLDLVFMDKSGKVLKCTEGVKPFRTASARGAYYTLELNQGMIQKQDIKVDDRFELNAVEKS